MIRSFRLFIALFVCLFALSCSKTKTAVPVSISKNGSSIICTTEILQDIVSQIAGESFEVDALIKGNLDPHSYELVKGEVEKLESAVLIFSNGLGLEHGSSLASLLHSSYHNVALGQWVFERHKEEFITVDGAIDPHFWMDPTLFAHVVDPVVENLSKLDPEKAAEFEKRGRALKQKLCELDQKCLMLVQTLPDTAKYLVTSHDAYNYFARRYFAKGHASWQKHVMAPQGLAPEAEISLIDIQRVCDFVTDQNVHVLFIENNISKQPHTKINEICRKKGHTTRIASRPLFGDTIDKNHSQAHSYCGMMSYNVQTIVEEIKAGLEEERS